MFKSFSFLVLNAALFGSGVFAATGSINSELSQLSKCAAVSGSKFANGTAIVIEEWDRNPNQKWDLNTGVTHFTLDNDDVEPPFCIDAQTVDTPSPVVLWQCDIQSLSQQWHFQTTGGVIRLVNNSKLCLEIPNSDDTDGVQLKTNTCNGGKNQIWYLA